MSEDEDDLVKGFINNFRSAIGTGVEDLAYVIKDYAPWYKPAETVLKNNTAGRIEEQAKKQFGNAKAAGVDQNVVDFLDAASKGLGYGVLGLKAGGYIQDGADAFDEYRNLRESGYSKDEATFIMAKKAPMYILSAKADDYIGKNSKVDEVLYGKTHALDPKENKKFREALNSRNTNDIIITGAQIGKKLGKHTKEYEMNPGSVDDRIKLLNIVDDIIDNADEVVEGNWKGYGNTLFYRKGEDLVLVEKKSKQFISIFKGGANNGWFKDLGR